MVISQDLLNALFLLVRFCAMQQDCSKCPLNGICNKQIQEW